MRSAAVTGWPGGYQVQFTVTNGTPNPAAGWPAGFFFADSAESVANAWNAAVSQSGTAVTAASVASNSAARRPPAVSCQRRSWC